MASNFFRIKNGANVQPIAGSTVTVEGDIAYNDTSNQLEVFGASAAESVTTASNTQTLTGKTIDADGTGNSITNLENENIKAAAAIALNKLAAATASRALVSDSSGFVSPATTTATEIGYVNGVTSAIQTQINTKAPSASPTFSGTITTPLTASRALATGASSELAASATTATELGYVNGVTSAIQTQINAITGGQFTSSHDSQNVGLACSVAGNALTIALKQADGSTGPSSGASACKIAFRNATAATGDYTIVQATAATSLVVSSGSTLGNASAVESFLWVYAINNAGTIELGVSSTRFDEGTVQSSTAEGGAGAADSNALIYSTTARTGKAIRLIARLRSTQTTAGTWAAVPTEISLIGPKTVTDNSPVGMRYTTSSQALGNGTTDVVILTVKDFDTHNAYSTSTGIYTVPADGMYSITGMIGHGTRTAAAFDLTSSIAIGGTAKITNNTYVSITSNPGVMQFFPSVTLTTRFIAGNQITLTARAGYASTSLDGSATGNQMSICRVGN